MKTILRPALVLFLLLTLICGVVYPGIITGIGRVAFPSKVDGSLISNGSGAVGSTLIGQEFSGPQYFWGRLSATSPMPYNASSSSGSNLGPTNPALLEEVKGRIAALKAADSGNISPVPIDLVTSSGSGLDPEISLAAAYYQVSRVSRLRSKSGADVRAMIDNLVSRQYFGFFGETRVNVLALNMALDRSGK
jgi:K+-transporting ATPase ATPase C chain